MIHHQINTVGSIAAAGLTGGSGLLWLVAQSPASEIPPALANQAGFAALYGLIATIATLALNGYFADRKNAREVDRRFADQVDEANRRQAALVLQVAEQKALTILADARSDALAGPGGRRARGSRRDDPTPSQPDRDPS